MLKRTRNRHSLEVHLFSDWTVSVSLRALNDEAPSAIILLAIKGKTPWVVNVSDGFGDYCTKELLDLWNALPKRQNVDHGEFNQKNGLRAINALVGAFAVILDAA